MKYFTEIFFDTSTAYHWLSANLTSRPNLTLTSLWKNNESCNKCHVVFGEGELKNRTQYPGNLGDRWLNIKWFPDTILLKVERYIIISNESLFYQKNTIYQGSQITRVGFSSPHNIGKLYPCWQTEINPHYGPSKNVKT